MNKFWWCILLLLLMSVSAEAVSSYKDTVYVRYSGENGEKSTIVVHRGCMVDEVEVPGHISKNESQSQLLARAYGEPLKDSSEIYSKWNMQCSHVHGENQEGWLYVFLGALYGPPAMYLGHNLIFRDYDNKGLMVLGRAGGAIWLITGAMAAFVGIVALGPSIVFSIIDGSSARSEEYWEKYKYWDEKKKVNLRFAPMINFNEPGGGLFMQLGF